MRGRYSHKRQHRQMRREDDDHRMALGRTCWNRGGTAIHLPKMKQEQVEIELNLWESNCMFCDAKIYKRTDDAGAFDPWMSGRLIIVEWP